MSSTYKSQAALRTLVDTLGKQLVASMPVITESFDSNGNPVVTFSADATPVAGEKVAVLRCKAIGSITKDVLNQPAANYSHHVYQLCTEANFAGTTDNVVDVMTAVELLPLLIEIGRCGSFVEWHQTASGSVPTVAAIDAGTNLKQTWRDLYWNVLKAS
jgi:hypothetical protein